MSAHKPFLWYEITKLLKSASLLNTDPTWQNEHEIYQTNMSQQQNQISSK